VRSSAYGAFRGCIAADHSDETTAILSEDEPFDAVGLYTGIARELSAP
jgi:hypothetical protein